MELTQTHTKVSTAEKYKENPFISAITVKTRAKKITVARGGMIVDGETGEIEGLTEIAQIIEVDQGQFLKLFTNEICDFFDINRSGLRVFACLAKTVQTTAIGRDIVYFDLENEFIQSLPPDKKMSRQTFYRGLEELLNKGFIARHVSVGWYFINPAIFFNGDRARFVKEIRITKDKKIKKDTKTIDWVDELRGDKK